MSLPAAERERWQPLRCGLIELYHYDVEEFAFRDGHLILRGNNGTGKSKVLSLTLPFLLDANLSASRVEPDGDRHKRMEWNLLMGGRYERRTGYTWVEFGRLDDSGQEHTLTLGCGLRAVAGRSVVEPWFFITQQRIGRDLWLTTPERVVLSKERLSETLGTHGQVFKTAEAYRRAIDERLFRLGAERYGALIDTLIQLRQPQLSKQPNEQRLSEALTESLAPLERTALESVADAMGQLEDLRRDLDELGAMRDAIAAFARRYTRYAQVATRRKARVLRQAQTEFDSASRALNATLEALDRARQKVEQWRTEEQRLGEQLIAARARLQVLQGDPVMRDAQRIAHAREYAEQCRRHAQDAEQRAELATQRLAAERERVASRNRDAQTTRAGLLDAQRDCAAHAAQAGLSAAHAKLHGGVAPEPMDDAEPWLDRAARTSAGAIETLRAGVRAIAQRRGEQIAALRACLDAVAAAEQRRTHARDRRDHCADALEAAAEQARQRAESARHCCAEALAAWRRHAAALAVLDPGDREALLSELELWLDTLDGANPMRRALDHARATLERELAVREAALAGDHDALCTEQDALRDEQERLEHGEDSPPPAPYTRDAGSRAARPGAPLWQLVDFAPALAEPERAGLEAALEAAGLLDAWLLPHGALLDARTHDLVLTARSGVARSLADFLVPSVPRAAASAPAPGVIDAVLRSIACAEQEAQHAEAWVSPHGAFRIGTVRGAWSKPRAAYIGHAARESARRTRLDAIAARLAELDDALAMCAAARARCETTRRAAFEEYAAAPVDEPLLRADAERNAAEHSRRTAQSSFGEADTQLSAAEHVLAEARQRLSRDARDLDLPDDAAGIERVAQSLNEYRATALDLASALRSHARALDEFDEQTQREARARADVETAAGAREHTRTARLEADAIVTTLQESIGKQVEELLAEIESTRHLITREQEAERHARAQLNVASQHRGTAENDRNAKQARLADRVHERKTAVAALDAFARETGMLAIALGEDVDAPESPWGVDAALTLARRAEQALARVGAQDPDWARVQTELGRDLTELQNAMSARGHSATAEPSDHGLIVRIVHQQRPERPDLLQRKLDAELADRRLLLSVREREVLEDHLEKEIAANLQRMIQHTEQRVAAMNKELAERPTSTGVRYRLLWQPLPEDSPDGVVGLVEARRRLLRTSADAWSADDRRQLGEFLQARIATQSVADDHASLFDRLARALDYRRWHRFRVQRWQDGQWRPLTGPASSGERALGLTVPLFAACSSHYGSADPRAPRLVLLDEAFAGIDDEARASCMALLRQFDLDFVMTSEREWGCYPEVPGLMICQLVRREGVDAVHVSRWTWDGHARVPGAEPAARFPEATTAHPADVAAGA